MRSPPIELLDLPFTMFETSISPREKTQGRAATIASVFLHLAMAIVLFTIAAPQAIKRSFLATPLYFSPSPPSVTRPQTTQPVRRILIPKPARALDTALDAPRFIPRPTKAELVPPEAPSILAPPSLALSLPPAPVTLPAPVPPRKPEIRTGAFESNMQTGVRPVDPATKVQSSGFDPAPDPASHPAVLTAKVQSSGFDSASHPVKNIRAAIDVGGAFGAVAVTPPSSRKEIAPSQFDAGSAKPSWRSGAPAASSATRSQLEIISKPRPLYTEEARRLRIEGEVVLQVIFRASSEICVLSVIRGLGHGLDENAISAAAAIRFRPATAGGRAIDDVATVRITFQLAE
jgi:TonB family protein